MLPGMRSSESTNFREDLPNSRIQGRAGEIAALVENVLPGSDSVEDMPILPRLIEAYTAHGSAKETSAADETAQPDRRKRPRILVHWPLLLTVEGGSEAIETQTQNLSSGGFYCFSPKPLMPGEALVCTLKAPAYDPKSDQRTIALECSAVVLRAEARPDGLFGLACRIEDYHLAA